MWEISPVDERRPCAITSFTLDTSSPAASKNNHMAHAYLDSANISELLLAVKNRLDAQPLTNYIPDECVFILS